MDLCKREKETMKNYKIAVAGTGYVGLSQKDNKKHTKC